MTAEQQKAIRRAWARCSLAIKNLEPKIDDAEFKLDMLKRQKEVLEEDMEVLEKMICPDEECEQIS